MATKKSDIDYSLNGDQPQSSLIGEMTWDVNPPDQSAAVIKNVIFKLANSNSKCGVWIPNVDNVINPKTGKMETIRLLNGVESIWQKDQKDLTPDAIKMGYRSLEFPRGSRILVIPEWDTAALEFARITRHNIGSPNNKLGSRFEFYEYDPEKQQKEAYEKEVQEMRMVLEAQKLPEDHMRKIASYLGIQFIDDLGREKSEDGIRTELMLKAKKNPVLFEKLLKSKKEVDVAFMIKSAILANRIELKQGGAHWAKTGVKICNIPPTIKPLLYLTELALTNSDEGKGFLEQIQQNIT